MTANTQILRDLIRSGAIKCECKQYVDQPHSEHCSWANAIRQIYEEERAAEGIQDDPKYYIV